MKKYNRREALQMLLGTSDLLADETINFIRRQTKAKHPWYAITAYIAPHETWECDSKHSSPLEKKGYSKALAAFYGIVRCPFEGLRGFTKAGDSATFSIDVRTAGKYEVAMKGEKLKSCATLTLEIGNKKLSPQNVTGNKIKFGTISLLASC